MITDIGEGGIAVVPIERVRFVREIGDEDVKGSVVVVIASVHAHAGLRDAICAVGTPREDGELGERAVAFVIEEVVRRVVVSDVKVWMSIGIEVSGDDA